MQIRRSTYELKLINPFGISRSTRTHSDVVLTRINGGWGEAAPIMFYQENAETVHAQLAAIEKMDLPDPDCVEDIADFLNAAIPGNGSAKAAVDIALHDSLAGRLGVPLYKFSGRAPDRKMVTSFTLGSIRRKKCCGKLTRLSSMPS